MTNYLIHQLLKLTARWRHTAENIRTASKVTPEPLMKGHIQGVSDGLKIAADDVEKVVRKPNGDTPI
ncbi:MAG: hypothetical protein ABI835_00580 [Chloroflexota bacterium]